MKIMVLSRTKISPLPKYHQKSYNALGSPIKMQEKPPKTKGSLMFFKKPMSGIPGNAFLRCRSHCRSSFLVPTILIAFSKQTCNRNFRLISLKYRQADKEVRITSYNLVPKISLNQHIKVGSVQLALCTSS